MKPLNLLRYSTHQITPEDEAAVLEALRSDWLTQGPVVERFEAALAEYVGARHCVAVNSGTAALHLAYLAAGKKTIIMPPLSFVATANAAVMAGARPEFVDVRRGTGLLELNPEALCDSAAYILVHYAGRAAQIPMPADRKQHAIIEDACHALGSREADGHQMVGRCGRSLAAVFSFHPVKPICTGEGGAITTNDEGFARELRLLRSHGRDADGLMQSLGYNYRMPEMSAALGLSQLKRCDEMRQRRCDLAAEYCRRLALSECCRCDHDPGSGQPQPPCRTSHHLMPIRITGGRRDEVKAKLNAAGIGAQIHYSPIIPLQPYWKNRFGYRPGEFPNAEAFAAETLSLPLHASMTTADVERVVVALREALA